MLIQQRYGLFPRIVGKGDNAQRLKDLLIRMRPELSGKGGSFKNNLPTTGMTPSATIENIVIIDREVDFSSALLTQLTYEGLIDELFGISHSQTELASSIVGNAPHQAAQDSPR